jgi:hypothetical protein
MITAALINSLPRERASWSNHDENKTPTGRPKKTPEARIEGEAPTRAGARDEKETHPRGIAERPPVVQTRFIDQPFSEQMRRQRWHYSLRAGEVGVTPQQLYTAARGIVVPSPLLRDKLPAILGVPLSQLFTAEALDYRYQDTHHRFDHPERKTRTAVSS